LRVITGTAGGRRLRVPRDVPIRPSADRTKETLFSMLESVLLRGRPEADVGTVELWEGLRVVDLYAGSGALGIEALSRGAAAATFFERDRSAVDAIRANLDLTGFGAQAVVVTGDVAQTLSRLPEGTDLVLLDPPYADPESLAILQRIAESPALAADAVVAMEHGQRLSPPDTLGTLLLQRSRRHGDTVLTLYARGRYARRAEVV
jgi:16S rRNA (guanine966-N2)-methyltransferase